MAEAAVEAAVSERGPRRKPGWLIVAEKEFADHLLSMRFRILLALIGLAALAAVYAVASEIRNVAAQASGTPSLFIRLFTVAPEQIRQFSYLGLVSLLAPLLGIAFGVDAINGERSQGTLPRLLAQPIHRDDVVNGKFVAGIAVIAMMLGLLTFLVAGVGMLRLGITPSGAEVGRIAVFWLISVAYAGFWLALALMFSITFRAATSIFAVIAAWLVLTIFAGFLFGLVADVLAPVRDNATPQEQLRNARVELNISRLSPATLYGEAAFVLLNPEVRSLGILFASQLDRAIPTQLSIDQSLLVVWPQATALVALNVVVFAIAYVSFMRQEVRA